jgi:hypothetical protein
MSGGSILRIPQVNFEICSTYILHGSNLLTEKVTSENTPPSRFSSTCSKKNIRSTIIDQLPNVPESFMNFVPKLIALITLIGTQFDRVLTCLE